MWVSFMITTKNYLQIINEEEFAEVLPKSG